MKLILDYCAPDLIYWPINKNLFLVFLVTILSYITITFCRCFRMEHCRGKNVALPLFCDIYIYIIVFHRSPWLWFSRNFLITKMLFSASYYLFFVCLKQWKNTVKICSVLFLCLPKPVHPTWILHSSPYLDLFQFLFESVKESLLPKISQGHLQGAASTEKDQASFQ